MNTSVRLAIIGFGWVAQDYFYPALQQVDGMQLVAICDPYTPKDLIPEGVNLYRSLDQMLEDEKLDAVYIATPNNLHARQIAACTQRQLAILCEKPLAASLEDAYRILENVSNASITYLSAFDQRYHPAHIAIRDLIQKGKIGQVIQVRIDYACWLDKEWAANNWRIDMNQAGGGAIIDLAPHGMDLVEYILNQEIEKIQVLFQSLIQDYEVDDGGVLNFQTDGGVIGNSLVAYNRKESLPRRRLEFIGTQGILLAENTMGQDPGGTLHYINAEDGSQTQIEFDQQASPFTRQVEHFRDCILEKEEVCKTVAQDVRLFELVMNSLKKENICL
ncbi:Gfo/Idh/MocA family oxidoreductase [Aquimarina sp. ERC-38]|uniref:Gfo/Idh/MocA family protein n=1 Tax=Aquimarina sp. ERC-38 TaxID=2949996 RepID=UPI002247958A|nr:Gfo/Idh/MocA family oxidoreductase [Aquimarina sp. ERC-38]UZO79262.1 Gfo/Idh/MocA family oxidoreductase [Aquimarina sp. ERC-38]